MPQVPEQPFLEILAATALILMFVQVTVFWDELPDNVPKHFAPSGKPDVWGGKGGILFLPALGLGLYVLFTVVSRFPRSWNWPFITEVNRERQLALCLRMMLVLKVGILGVFTYALWKTIQTALGQESGLGPAFGPLILAVALGIPAFFLYRAWQER